MLLPVCDAFLEIKMSSPELGSMLAAFELYAPQKHREFLQEVSSWSVWPVLLTMSLTGEGIPSQILCTGAAAIARSASCSYRRCIQCCCKASA